MALQTFTLPDNDYRLPNTRDQTTESGESWRKVLVKSQAMFAELYASNTSNLAADAEQDASIAAIEVVNTAQAASIAAVAAVNTTQDTTIAAQAVTIATKQPILATDGVGAVAGLGVTAAEYGNGATHKTVLTFISTAVTLVDEAGVGAYGSLKVYDFPEGFLHFMGAVTNLTLGVSAGGVNADWDGDFGLGTVAAGGDGTLATTEQDLIPTTATPQAVASVSSAKGASTATEAGAIHDGHTTPKDAFLNILVDDADHDVTGTPTNIVVNGTITLLWANLGDFT